MYDEKNYLFLNSPWKTEKSDLIFLEFQQTVCFFRTLLRVQNDQVSKIFIKAQLLQSFFAVILTLHSTENVFFIPFSHFWVSAS